MSRAQQQQVINEARPQNATNFTNAQTSFQASQDALDKSSADIGAYQAELAKYAGGNPYLPGGEYQTSQDQVIADTADASARAAGAGLQALSKRTGQNPTTAVAATEAMEQQGERTAGAQKASANADRINKEAEYRRGVLGATGAGVNLEQDQAAREAALYGIGSGAANTALGIQEGAARTPGFWDTLGSSFAGALGGRLATGGRG